MATKREELEIGLRATDRASEIVSRVADEVDRLDGRDADVSITAEDKASAEVRELMTRIDSLTDDDKKVILTAEAKKLEAEVKRATVLLGRVDGEQATAVLDARNQAQTKLDAVTSELNSIDGRIADATLEADDRATADINEVDDKLDRLDRKGVDAEIEADVGPGLSGVLESLDGMPGNIGALGPAMSKLTTPGGAATLLAAALAGAALSTSQTALDVDSLSKFTGEDFAYTDKFIQVAETWGNLDLNDLFEIIAELQSKLRDTPDLAEKFGVDPELVINSPLQGIVALIDGIRESSLSASEKAEAMFALFGEEGAKQLIPLLTTVEDLAEEVDSMPSLVDEDGIENAKDLQREFNKFKTQVGAAAATIGGPLLDNINKVLAAGNADSEIPWWINPAAWGLDQLLNGDDTHGSFSQDLMINGVPADEYLAGLEGAQDDAADATADHTARIDEQIGALEEEQSQLEENVEALTGYIDAQRSAYDSSIDYRESIQESSDALADYAEVVADTEATETDRREAGEKVIDSMVDQADAAVDLARANAQARGETLSAAQAANVQISAYSSLAAQIPRELIPQYVDMLMAILDIPEERRTEVTAAVESGDVAEVNRVLSEASRTRTAAIRADAEAWSIRRAEGELAWLARQRTAVLSVHTGYSGGGGGIGPVARAHGDPYTRAGMFRVGDQGEELVELPEGSKITPNWRMNERRDGTPTVVNNYMTINAPPGTTPDRVINAARRYDRIQGTRTAS